MPRKTYRREEIIAKLRQGEGLIGQGKEVSEVNMTAGDDLTLEVRQGSG